MASEKEQIWLSEYLKTFNATEAARRAGYTWPNVQGQQKKEKFRDEIKRILAERAMSPQEIIDELQQIAQSDIADYFDRYNGLDLEKAQKDGKSKLIKKLKWRTITKIGKGEGEDDVEIHDTEMEMYSRHEALRDLGKVHALFTDKTRAEDWRTDLIALLKKGDVTPEVVLKSLDPETATALLREAGVAP